MSDNNQNLTHYNDQYSYDIEYKYKTNTRYQRYLVELLEKEMDHIPDSVLDVGCGGGQTLYRLAETYPEAVLDGIDYSEVSVELSRETNETYIADGRMAIHQASVDELPFEDDSFDKVITVESFYFWPDHDKGLKEIRRVLKPNGKLLIICEVYGDAPLSPRERENIQKYTMFNPTRAEYRELLERNGLRDVEIHVGEQEKSICVIGTK